MKIVAAGRPTFLTPAASARSADFLRAVSILVVVTGHWLVAAAYYQDGTLTPSDVLEFQPKTQGLSGAC